ncbi:MAG: S1-like domain-containing RNA-binding protein [Rikenellaceae bacterium]
MIISGIVNSLKISRFTENGAYLCDEEGAEVLMPNRYLNEQMLVGDDMEAFVYHDSEDRQVAVTDRPYAMVGEVAYLEVVDNNQVGAFVDWGLPKDLLIPKKNQLFELYPGKRYVVAVYRDMVTGRVVATTKLNNYIYNDDLDLNVGDKVTIMVAIKSDFGYRVIIENRHWGVIYNDQIFKPVSLGDKLEGYVKRITEDKRVDISLRSEGLSLVQESSSELKDLLKQSGGFLPLGDKYDPELIHSTTGMSKKSFKRAVGMLMKSKDIEMTEEGIKLLSKDENQ